MTTDCRRSRRSRRSRWARWTGPAAKLLLVVAVAAGGLWTVTHGVAGVAWTDVAPVLRAVTPGHLGLLAVIWLSGLGIYSTVLAAALPGLGVRRGLLLNLSGSAVANVLPLGGAAATALNWRMVRRWGHTNLAFVSYCVLTNALDVVTKLLLPLVAVGAFVLLSEHVPAVLWAVAGGCAVALVLGAAVLACVRERGARVRGLLRRGWTRLLPASAGYIAAQVALLLVSLRSVGLHVPLTVVLMAAAIERLGTLVPVTPAGTGVAEIGTVAWLLTTGLSPAQVVAGVLLYRVFLVVMEIPVGGALLAGWAWLQRASRGHPEGAAA